ncbi:hypothetical protein [Ruegeria meonggei]|uniref:hypothetical protein n=1 Tax=Ruegeria meonggei TaxID=1446476 RepID=UPI00366B61E8
MDSFLDHVMRVIAYPVDPNNRIFALYFLSSLVIVFAIYLVKRRKSDEADGESSFVGFLFPKKVWSHPSAWLDVRYFFFHQFIGHFLKLGLFAGSAARLQLDNWGCQCPRPVCSAATGRVERYRRCLRLYDSVFLDFGFYWVQHPLSAAHDSCFVAVPQSSQQR